MKLKKLSSEYSGYVCKGCGRKHPSYQDVSAKPFVNLYCVNCAIIEKARELKR